MLSSSQQIEFCFYFKMLVIILYKNAILTFFLPTCPSQKGYRIKMRGKNTTDYSVLEQHVRETEWSFCINYEDCD